MEAEVVQQATPMWVHVAHIIELIAVLALVVAACKIAIIIAKKDKVFENARDRDSTMYMCLAFGLIIFLLYKFGDKVSAETLGGVIIGVTGTVGTIGGYLFGKQMVDNGAKKEADK